MSEDSNKKSENKGESPLNNQPSPNKKKRRRRRRKKKPANQPQEQQGQTPNKQQKEPEIIVEPINIDEALPPEPVVEEVKAAEPPPSIDEFAAEEPVSTEDEGPSEFNTGEEPEGPVGWDQLKDAIKKDYDETEENDGPLPPVVPEEPAVEEPVVEPEPEVTPEPSLLEESEPEATIIPPIPPPAAEAEPVSEPQPQPTGPVAPTGAAFEDDQERKEVFRIISKYLIGGCVVIVIIVGIFVFKIPQGIYGAVSSWFGGGDAVVQTQDTSDDRQTPGTSVTGEEAASLQTTFLAGGNSVTSLGRFEEGVQTVILTGEDQARIRKLSSGLQTVFSVGSPQTQEDKLDRIATYMGVLMQLQNAFSTDIHKLLDNSKNRSEALTLHLRELNDIQAEAKFVLQEVNENKDDLKVEFNEVTDQKEQLEGDFFISMEQLEGPKANTLLNKFIDASQDQINLKAEYNALVKVAKMFDTATQNMAARIKDIEFNREALVKGVQVVDIKGSDLNLIIDEPTGE